jgi:hypothetical protein
MLMNFPQQKAIGSTNEKDAGLNLSLQGKSGASLYQHSFGMMPDGMRYYDPMAGVDAKSREPISDYRTDLAGFAAKGLQSIQAKALNTTSGGAGTAGTTALVPVYVDGRIVDQSRKYTPLVEMLPRVTNMGLTADYNVITAKGAAFTANPDAPLSENDDTEDRQSKSIKYLYSVGRVLGQMQAAMPSYILEGMNPTGAGNTGASVFNTAQAPDAKQYQVLLKARALKELEENLILNGDSSSDATEFDGLITIQSTTNQNDLSTTALTWDDIEDTVRMAYDDGGRPKLAVGSSSVIIDIRKILIDSFNYRPADFMGTETLPVGVPPMLHIETIVGKIPVIPSQYLSNVSGSKQLWFFDTDYIEVRVLQDMTYEELAKTNDSNKFMLKIYECVINRAPSFSAYIDNIL